MDITEFLNDVYNESALYIAYRNTASYIDGLKNSTRKLVYTIKKKGLSKPVKVSALGSAVVDNAGYLHGDVSIQGVIATAAKNYCGSNNIPIIEGIGSFGTRFSNKAAAPRYIFAAETPYFDDLFKHEDDPNLKSQMFEGEEIEPVYYVPTLPMLLVNGSSGIGVGFASDIFPRSIENVFKIVRAKLEGKTIKKDWFNPCWEGFGGTIEKVEDSWVIKGKATFDGKKVLIEEVPIEWELKPYQNHLTALKEDGKITKFNDYAEDDNFKFEVILTPEELAKGQEAIMKDLGLVKPMTEVLTCIDENNSIREYDSVKDIFEDYYKIKIKSLEARKKSEIQRLEIESDELGQKYKFIMEVIKGTVDIKLKKAQVEKILAQKKYTIIDKLLAMPVSSLTEDRAKELEKNWKNKLKELEDMKNETPKTLWSKDLDKLEDKLKKEGVM